MYQPPRESAQRQSTASCVKRERVPSAWTWAERARSDTLQALDTGLYVNNLW
jgi:hypothetical protein